MTREEYRQVVQRLIETLVQTEVLLLDEKRGPLENAEIGDVVHDVGVYLITLANQAETQWEGSEIAAVWEDSKQ